MKIALVTDGIYPYVIGGMQKHSFYLAKYLAQNGAKVDLYHTNQSDKDISKLELFSESEKKNIRSLVFSFPHGNRMPGHYLRDSYHYSCMLFNAFIENSPVDFIYAKGFTAWKFAGEKAKGRKLPPLGVNFHGYEMFQQAPSLKSFAEQVLLFRKPVKYIVKHADYLFSYGGKITGLIRKLDVPASKIKAIPAGIEENWLSSGAALPREKRKFVFIGRYERRKGLPELNKVLKEISPSYHFEFVFIGPIPDRHRLHLPGIHYAGSVTDSVSLKQLLDGCDVLVCPSHSEGMPNVILEAMSRGLGIIATDVGAVAEMVGADNGWLIEPSDKLQLKNALVSAIKANLSDLLQKKNASLEKVRTHFLWTSVIRQTIHELAAATILPPHPAPFPPN